MTSNISEEMDFSSSDAGQKDKVSVKISHNVSEFNRVADYWYYEKKVNVIPVNSRNKTSTLKWEKYQQNRIPGVDFEHWKRNSHFNSGIVIILGKTYDDRQALYLIGIDCDSRKAIDEFSTHNGKYIPIERLSEKMLVEQHKDDPDRLHGYFFSPIPFPNMGANSIGLEIKGNEGKGYLVAYPSIHKNGYQYEILGLKEPPVFSLLQANEMLHHLDGIFKKNGMNYLQNLQKGSPVNPAMKKMIQKLQIDYDIDYSIDKGQRHNSLVSIANSILFHHFKENTNANGLKVLGDFFRLINDSFCKPSPQPESDVSRIWKDSVEFVKKNKDFSQTSVNQVKTKDVEESKRIETIAQTTEQLLEKYCFATFEESKSIYYYKDGVYVPGGETLIERESETICGYSLSNGSLSEIKGHIIRKSFCKRDDFDKDINIINVKNGLYNIKENRLTSHDPYYLSLNQKPVIYNRYAKSKLFVKFLKEILYSSEVLTTIDMMGYTFYRDCPFEYFFKLYGHGSNGKSVFTELVTSLHGTRNVSSVSMSRLLESRFALADLEFKDVNIDTELSNVPIKDTSLLKKLTGGRRQQVVLERKFQHSYQNYLYSKLIFNTNTINENIDESPAYYRREVIISFPNTFAERDEKTDISLPKKLTTDLELSGIFNILMISLRRILKNGGIYLNEKTAEERREKVERAKDSIGAFLTEAVSEDSTESDWASKERLYKAYLFYCKKYKIAPKSMIIFGKDMKKKGWSDSRKTYDNERYNSWTGLRLNSEYDVVLEEKQAKLTLATE